MTFSHRFSSFPEENGWFSTGLQGKTHPAAGIGWRQSGKWTLPLDLELSLMVSRLSERIEPREPSAATEISMGDTAISE